MTQKDKTKQAGMTVDPAAIGLMASIVAKSITQFVRSSPQSNLASESLINDLSKTIAKDLNRIYGKEARLPDREEPWVFESNNK